LRRPFFIPMLPSSSGLFFLFIFYYSYSFSRSNAYCVCKNIQCCEKLHCDSSLHQTKKKKKSVFIYNIFFWPSFVKSDFAFYHFNGFPSSCSIKLITEHSPLSFVSVCEGVIVIIIIIITESRHNTGLYIIIMSYNIYITL